VNDRPSAWGYGLGLGMAVTGGVLAAHVHGGHVVPQWWVFYPSLIVAVMGIVVGLSGLGHGLSWGLDLAERVREYRAGPQNGATSLLDAPEAIVDEEPDTDAETEAMRLAVEIWFRAGDALGSFSENSLTGAGVCGSDVWPRLAGFYSSDGGHAVLRVVPGNVGTTWNYGHNLDSTLLGLASARIPLPPGRVPVVKPYVRPATQRGAAQKGATRKRTEVVDIEASREVV
jgi:hypothetical protein